MNVLFNNSMKLNTGPDYEQEIHRIYIAYYGQGELGINETMLFTYPPLKNCYSLPNLKMNDFIK